MKSAYFLQPMPAWGKTLTEDEKARRRRPGLRRPLSPHGRRHDDARERGLPIYDLGDIFKNDTSTIYADQIHYLADAEGRQPRQPHGGRPDRRAAGQDLGPAAQALKGFPQFPQFPLPPLSHFWGACTASGIQTFRHSRYFRQRAKCGGKASPTMDWASSTPSSRPERRRAGAEGPILAASENRSLRYASLRAAAPVGMTGRCVMASRRGRERHTTRICKSD